MNRNGKSGFARFLILIVYIVYSLYYLEDMQTSANVVIKQTESRGSVHLFLMMLIGLLAIYMIFRTLFTGRIKISSLNAPLILLAVWGVFSDFLNGVSFWSIAVHIGLIVLWVLVIYFMNDIVYDNKTYNMVIFFEYVVWLITMYYAITALINFNNYNGEESVSGVLNISYNVLVLVPFIFQLKNKFLKYSALLVSCGFIVLSMKRGAILALMFMLLIYFYFQAKTGKIKITLPRIVFVIGLFVCAFLIVNKVTDNYLMSRFTWESLTEGSNRSIIYAAAINDIFDRNFVEFLIGKGSGSSLATIGSGVHNEILEMLFSYGLIGLIIYLWLIIRGLKLVFRLLKEKSNASAIYAMSVVYIVFVGLVGTALFAHYTFHIMASIGIASGYLKREAEISELR